MIGARVNSSTSKATPLLVAQIEKGEQLPHGLLAESFLASAATPCSSAQSSTIVHGTTAQRRI